MKGKKQRHPFFWPAVVECGRRRLGKGKRLTLQKNGQPGIKKKKRERETEREKTRVRARAGALRSRGRMEHLGMGYGYGRGQGYAKGHEDEDWSELSATGTIVSFWRRISEGFAERTVLGLQILANTCNLV